MKKLSPGELERVHAFMTRLHSEIRSIPGKTPDTIAWYKKFSEYYHGVVRSVNYVEACDFRYFDANLQQLPKVNADVNYLVCNAKRIQMLEQLAILEWIRNQIKDYSTKLVRKNVVNDKTINLKRDLEVFLSEWRVKDVTVLYVHSLIALEPKPVQKLFRKFYPRAMFILGLDKRTTASGPDYAKDLHEGHEEEEVTGVRPSPNRTRLATNNPTEH